MRGNELRLRALIPCPSFIHSLARREWTVFLSQASGSLDSPRSILWRQTLILYPLRKNAISVDIIWKVSQGSSRWGPLSCARARTPDWWLNVKSQVCPSFVTAAYTWITRRDRGQRSPLITSSAAGLGMLTMLKKALTALLDLLSLSPDSTPPPRSEPTQLLLPHRSQRPSLWPTSSLHYLHQAGLLTHLFNN